MALGPRGQGALEHWGIGGMEALRQLGAPVGTGSFFFYANGWVWSPTRPPMGTASPTPFIGSAVSHRARGTSFI